VIWASLLESARRAMRYAVSVTLLSFGVTACTAGIGADSSIEFGPSSYTAIVILGTSANPAQVFSWSGESLSTFWQKYDPADHRLVRNGESFRTKILRGPFISTDYRNPTVTVLEVAPGDYALTAAGFPHVMTLFVPRNADDHSPGYIVDPRRHIDPQAPVNPRQNFVFSVERGQIAYIGHFNFVKDTFRDQLVSIAYSQDPAAAREALKEFPGIIGELTVFNLEQPTESAAVFP